jgi:hypothetical protein
VIQVVLEDGTVEVDDQAARLMTHGVWYPLRERGLDEVLVVAAARGNTAYEDVREPGLRWEKLSEALRKPRRHAV